ncbi:MmgE/PrpD family protein [Aquamicrobium sp. cd-1]|uniref:MmgE/PrpD family protein n=2 Tax=Aquamicrobium zhengzhouense TaxID=2781738 RepID=A0ABS0SGK1_9HYPH|nr:MmgE/PrpD family protein [Aquamicrobium zhengzhouense]
MMSKQNLTQVLADYVAGSSYAQLPADVVERTKLIIFDEIACAILGRQLIAGELITRFTGSMGGTPEATVLGTKLRLPAAAAALANGTAGHADEFDGAHVTDGHPGAVVVHSTLAIAEARRVTGRDYIHSISLGYDVGTRLVASVGGAFSLRNAHHIHSDHLHSYGAAMACAKLLRLDSDGIRYAAALASGYAGGLAVVFEERRHMSKALSTGQAASGGVTAALLAASGFEGHDYVFDSKHGPLGWASADREVQLSKGLGSEFAVNGANFKFYSAGYPIHAPVEAALLIVDENKLAINDIASVTVRLTKHTADTVSNREMPSICVEDMMAVAIVHGRLGFTEAHSATAIARPEVKALRPKIRAVADEEMDRTLPHGRGAIVEIETLTGTHFRKRIDHPQGHALRGGVDWSALHGKWEDLLPNLIGKSNFKDFFIMCQSLDQLDDIGELTSILRT